MADAASICLASSPDKAIAIPGGFGPVKKFGPNIHLPLGQSGGVG